MSDFDIQRFSDDARQRMATALAAEGLRLDPPLTELDRRETVVLCVDQLEGDGRRAVPCQPLAAVLTVRAAGPGQHLRCISNDQLHALPSDEVRWFDLAQTGHLDKDEVLRTLGPLCNDDLTPGMVDDLLSPDPRPRIKLHEDTGVRCVAAFQVHACESDEGAAPDSVSKAGILVFEPVEFLVGSNWMITGWHDVEVYRGADRIRESAPTPPRALFREVERCWPAGGLSTAGDLALLVLRELALTYAPAYRQFYVWEEEWELDFYRRPDRIDRETLLEVRAAAAVLRDWLSPLNPPGMRQDVARAWFPGISGSRERGGFEIALRIDDRIDSALRNLREFNDTLRSAYDLLQLREGERERERDDRFQRNIAVGGSAILIPTLVAGVMGVNTWVPGQWREKGGPPHWAFLALVAFVILSGAVAWAAIHRLQKRDAESP